MTQVTKAGVRGLPQKEASFKATVAPKARTTVLGYLVLPVQSTGLFRGPSPLL